jgi:hypothetical protein
MFGVGLAMGCILGAAICGIYGAVYENFPHAIHAAEKWIKERVRR